MQDEEDIVVPIYIGQVITPISDYMHKIRHYDVSVETAMEMAVDPTIIVTDVVENDKDKVSKLVRHTKGIINDILWDVDRRLNEVKWFRWSSDKTILFLTFHKKDLFEVSYEI